MIHHIVNNRTEFETIKSWPDGDRVLVMDDPFAVDTGVSIDALVEIVAQTKLVWLLMTERPEEIVHAPSQVRANPSVWWGVRCETKEDVDGMCEVLAGLKVAGKKWMSCTPRGALTVPACLDWVVCGGDERPMYPAAALHLRDAAAARGVPFLFLGWGGWVETHKWPETPKEGDEPQLAVELGDSVVQLDGSVIGTVDHIWRHDDGKLKDISYHRTGKRDRALGAVAFMRFVGMSEDRKLDGVEHNDAPA